MAWKVKAIGGHKGYGGYGKDDGYGHGGYGGEVLEFGQQEHRHGYKTEGAWASDLPYESSMKMKYLVDAQPVKVVVADKGYGYH